MSNELDSYPGSTEVDARALLPISRLLEMLNEISSDRVGRLEMMETISKAATFNHGSFRPGMWPTGLRSELIKEFEKLGLLSSEAWSAADVFLKAAKKGELK